MDEFLYGIGANGPHVLFVTANSASGLSGWEGAPSVTNSKSVSAYVPVLFSNYISQLYFSEPAFGRSSGPTQTVSAVFSAYSSWTLQIVNQDSNAVRNASGEGHTLQFGWDGKDDGGTAVPPGDYQFLVSAIETNEPPQDPPPDPEPPPPPPSPGGEGGMSSIGNEAWYPTSFRQALLAGCTFIYVPAPPMPPVELNGTWYAWEDIYGPVPPIEVQIPLRVQEAFWQSLIQSQSLADSQTGTLDEMSTPATAQGPSKPPTSSAIGTRGVFGVAYFTYPTSPTYQNPDNGMPPPLNQKIRFGGVSGTSTSLTNTLDFTLTANGFVNALRNAGWAMAFNKSDGNLTYLDLVRSDLYGGQNLFNQVDIGLFMAHGNYGITLDYNQAANQSYQTYFPVGSQANKWIRMSDFRFGNRLKWMAIMACHSIEPSAYQSMGNKEVLPMGDLTQGFTNHLHLLLGCRTYAATTPSFGQTWVNKMKRGSKVKEAWFNTGKEEYKGIPRTGIFANDLYFRVVGYETTFDDTWNHYTNPNPSADYLDCEDRQVFP